MMWRKKQIVFLFIQWNIKSRLQSLDYSQEQTPRKLEINPLRLRIWLFAEAITAPEAGVKTAVGGDGETVVSADSMDREPFKGWARLIDFPRGLGAQLLTRIYYFFLNPLSSLLALFPFPRPPHPTLPLTRAQYFNMLSSHNISENIAP